MHFLYLIKFIYLIFNLKRDCSEDYNLSLITLLYYHLPSISQLVPLSVTCVQAYSLSGDPNIDGVDAYCPSIFTAFIAISWALLIEVRGNVTPPYTL